MTFVGLYLSTDTVLKLAMTQGETQECRRKMGLKIVKISPHQGQLRPSLLLHIAEQEVNAVNLPALLAAHDMFDYCHFTAIVH